MDVGIAAGNSSSPTWQRPDSRVPPDDLAYTVVRVIESYVYLEVITGEQPDAGRSGRVLRALLPPGPARPT